ncbi:hypothetical protein HYPSUDRAFT_198438 [Hypholoma sublateritium FD-334 SS-4]|uniref:FCP1 homology domain-containing protein n=1 Tax=Hypholoma sublateritium (strain FD-334 SS-4) TaxID=945553 RepID=A0A0D2P849_HYPSF|nr:hypothetical protein HYPSUDRAFT_198438 [Hypholoma sublateritium FD-334 SS-4]
MDVNGPAASIETTEDVVEQWNELEFTWAGKPFKLRIPESDRLFDMKLALHDLTRVPSERQKIIGLVKGKLPPDETRIQILKLVPTYVSYEERNLLLLGHLKEKNSRTLPAKLESLPDVINDLDVDFTENMAASNRYQHDLRNIRKVQEATKNLQINIIHPLREGKKLLVLDIDYTILDTKPLTSGSLPPAECARPGLHEFLEAIYPFYDICIWSQTSWVWLETKLVELGMVGAQRNYQISFVLDKTCMFTVFTERDNKPWKHSVKALQIIWNHFPQFHAKNTIHVDDLSRNFALNPKEGLKISAFKDAHTPEALADRELVKLSRYMVHIANSDDFTTLSHKNWKNVVKRL